ncbi:hypothetical protein [Hydrogenophaga sp. RAC07]|uniref:hypothetical protein n=1 Tax=Hydrogenophaga sp. RAC07 TaxID=1842537 RepID=UPI00083D5C12|nr:hypothetical protein [Hydrogenophaga sp. RAC07]
MNMYAALVFFVLVLTAAGFAAAYFSLRTEACEMRDQQGILLGRSKLLEGFVDEVSATWAGLPQGEGDVAEWLALGCTVSRCLPQLVDSPIARARQIALPRHKFTEENFASSNLSDEYSQINKLISVLDDPQLSQLWTSRRLLDMMSMMRFVQAHLCKGSVPRSFADVPDHGNPLIRMLREEVDAMVICAEIGRQAQSLGGTNELAGQTAPADRALEGIVEALSFRRNGLGKPFTLAVLVLALSARGLEDLYRECRHDAESVHGSWRVQFNNLRSYVECLPGWDGRLPFTDMMVATHNAHVARVLHVLMRVS